MKVTSNGTTETTPAKDPDDHDHTRMPLGLRVYYDEAQETTPGQDHGNEPPAASPPPAIVEQQRVEEASLPL